MENNAKNKPTSILGGSLFLKIIVLIAIGIIVWVLISGVKLDLGDIVFTTLKVIFAVVLIALVAKGIQGLLKPKPFSPTEDFREKIIRIAKMSMPFNVKKLALRGEDMRVYSYIGKIIGLAFVPYFASVPERDPDGKIIYENKTDLLTGQVVVDLKTKQPIKVQKMKPLTEKDGDWLFVIRRGFFLFAKEEIVRANYRIVSDIGETIWIKDVNFCPVGEYLYPAKQWQEDIIRIKIQHQAEALVQTHMNFLDLLSQLTQMSLGGDPTYQKILQAQSEALGQQNAGFLVRGGN